MMIAAGERCSFPRRFRIFCLSRAAAHDALYSAAGYPADKAEVSG